MSGSRRFGRDEGQARRGSLVQDHPPLVGSGWEDENVGSGVPTRKPVARDPTFETNIGSRDLSQRVLLRAFSHDGDGRRKGNGCAEEKVDAFLVIEAADVEDERSLHAKL